MLIASFRVPADSCCTGVRELLPSGIFTRPRPPAITLFDVTGLTRLFFGARLFCAAKN